MSYLGKIESSLMEYSNRLRPFGFAASAFVCTLGAYHATSSTGGLLLACFHSSKLHQLCFVANQFMFGESMTKEQRAISWLRIGHTVMGGCYLAKFYNPSFAKHIPISLQNSLRLYQGFVLTELVIENVRYFTDNGAPDSRAEFVESIKKISNLTLSLCLNYAMYSKSGTTNKNVFLAALVTWVACSTFQKL